MYALKLPNFNLTEAANRELKIQWCRMDYKRNVPDMIWYFGISYVFNNGNVTTRLSRYYRFREHLYCVTGITSDITEYQ